ncbi:phytanoyl-CoA dioxygenase family protein [Luteitalea sp.]|uniref:phytanoyl-CoA dioxygenase family protein n=1 Tax=Luteitalea sp. TaxID=2004800 RepID=UPI0025BFA2AF|nr:phytanoyl-CoA dioxygenase family protein [Luteitalea sp.]
MTFRSDGYAVFPAGLTDEALRGLLALSHRHEAASRPGDGRTWGERQLHDVATPAPAEMLTAAARAWIAGLGFAARWRDLEPDMAHPQLTYSFQVASPVTLALREHTDGLWPRDSDRVARSEFLLGTILEDVPSLAHGPYVCWPGSHREAIDHLDALSADDVADGFRTLPDGRGRPMPILGRAGDIVVAHRLLRHGTAPRAFPGVRRMAFFRLGHRMLPAGTRVRDSAMTQL